MSFGQWPSNYLGVPIEERFNFNPLTYFLYSGIDGAWFDPSDLSTLFQDVAGTIPVTAVEQPVGKILDKSGKGNHATQSITASRPTLSARKNILLATETLATQSVATLASTYTLSFTGTGSVTLSGAATGTLTGNSADRVSLTFTPTAGTLTLTVSGSVTKAQFELGAVAGQYQRVNTATDYDTDERYFKKYLRFDGIDDYLNLPYMGLYANGSASVVAAIDEPPSLPANQTIFAEGNSLNTTPTYSLVRRLTSGVGGSSVADTGVTNFSYTSPFISTPNTVESSIDAGNSFSFYRKSALIGGATKTTATTTLNNTTIGAINRGGVVQLFSVLNLYGLIITKSPLTDSQRVACERYLGRKSGVQL